MKEENSYFGGEKECITNCIQKDSWDITRPI
jgi:hypothetical protein